MGSFWKEYNCSDCDLPNAGDLGKETSEVPNFVASDRLLGGLLDLCEYETQAD
jgi:hypothetical protein